ncbi:MAG: hypothetical protein EP343_00775 [Deltaproteobacteria bacterium]|nr:MAG: hypothetical protein EP343_00775 [Deltaproteobacteria bacterium]
MRRYLSICLCFVCCGWLWACGASLDNPGVEGTKPMGSLTSEEQKTLAEVLTKEVFNEDFIKTSCQISALISGSSDGKETCEQLKQNCEASAALGASAYATQAMQQFSQCNVTVKVWADCMKATKSYMEQVKSAMAGKTCGDPIDSREMSKGIDMVTFQQQCGEFYSKCSFGGGLPGGGNPFPSGQQDTPVPPPSQP